MIDPLQLRALELAAGLAPIPSNLQKVARGTDEAAARWAFGQWALRERAADRFPHAPRMLFVREALEQATHAELAAYHASLFPAGVPVADLTCGIGGDLLALAARGQVLGFELDPERAAYARWNLQALGLTGEVREADGLAWLRENEAPYVIVDPARRVEGRRTLDPADFSPNPFEFAEAATGSVRWAMKLTPMLSDETLRRLGPRTEFVSFGGECREALILGGDVEVGVWAVRPGLPPLRGDGPDPARGQAEGWLHDADPAAVRAHALGGFGLAALGDAPGYLVGEHTPSPWLRAFRILDEVAPKKLKAALKALGAAAPVLKQRGAGQDLDRWHRDLGRHGERPLAVAFYREGAAIRAAILDPAAAVEKTVKNP